MNAMESLASEVIVKSASMPADAALREMLKASHLPRTETAAVADLVFKFFRWEGWLNGDDSFEAKFASARELDQRFGANPDSFTDEELRRAVPAWAGNEVPLTRPWLALLQTRPALWLRSKNGAAEQVSFALGDCRKGPIPDALEYCGTQDLFRTPQFQSGDFEVQDIASQIVGLLCDPKPGQTWWDACAGEGGKTLHFSELMRNKGLIWASDRSERRLVRLKQRAGRAKVFNYRAAAWDGSSKLPTKTKFDGVLIDAPCSGVGTWQRNAHARWTTTPKDVEELAAIQRQLVLNAAVNVKPGGKLIYAVCTLTRSESELVADRCSEELAGFEPSAMTFEGAASGNSSNRLWIWPQAFRGNGMFVAAWRRVA